jgi:hypothetical protein
MHENNGFVFGEHYVGFTGKLFVVEAVAETMGVQEFADNQFGFGVFATYPRHIVAALFGGVYVGHVVR